MRLLTIMLVWLLFLNRDIHAANYFDFVPSGKFVGYNNSMEIDIFYDLVGFDEEQFLVRPVVDAGVAYIFSSFIQDLMILF